MFDQLKFRFTIEFLSIFQNTEKLGKFASFTIWGALYSISCRSNLWRCDRRQQIEIVCMLLLVVALNLKGRVLKKLDLFYQLLLLQNFHEMAKEMVGGCCVCSDDEGWDDNPLVYCDGQDCTVAVHKGLQFLSKITFIKLFVTCTFENMSRYEIYVSINFALLLTFSLLWNY